ncbi:MAG: hypothetical protein JO188_19070 [Hyphomicrobiales bacterium]|nr:hypothetical protein [Hyphomicrobiales bacterium]
MTEHSPDERPVTIVCFADTPIDMAKIRPSGAGSSKSGRDSAALGKLMRDLGLVDADGRPKSLPAFPDSYVRRGLEVNANAYVPERATRDPSNADRMADRCTQVGRVRNPGNQLVPEPVWKGVLGTLPWCEDGEAKAHEWSKTDPRYRPNEAQGKFDRSEQLSGPTTCVHFERLDPDTCKACPFRGRVTTPVDLGRSTFDDSPRQAQHPVQESSQEPVHRPVQASTAETATDEKLKLPPSLPEDLSHFRSLEHESGKKYLFVAGNQVAELWPAKSVNTRIGKVPAINMEDVAAYDANGRIAQIPASDWLDQNLRVAKLAWAPGEPFDIRDRIPSAQGWIHQRGYHALNLYRAPVHKPGDGNLCGLWLDHIKWLWPDCWRDVVRFQAHRIQRPGEKINWALVEIGGQGIGKDLTLVPLREGVGGEPNFASIGPKHLFERFNPWMRSIVLLVSETNSAGREDKHQVYNKLQTIITVPPTQVLIDDKHIRQHFSMNVSGVIITSNDASSLHIPPDDRRMFIAHSPRKRTELPADYFRKLVHWYRHENGIWHVVDYLMKFDLSGFDPMAPPAQTRAFNDIVSSEFTAPFMPELLDALEKLGNPKCVTIAELAAAPMLAQKSGGSFDMGAAALSEFLQGTGPGRVPHATRAQIPHRMHTAGYVRWANAGAKDGLWKVSGRRQVVYVREELAFAERNAAVNERYGNQ